MATEIDLTTSATFTVNGAIFSTDVQTIGAGTGAIDPFVRVEVGGSGTTEQGYNTGDTTAQPLDDKDQGGSNFNHALLLTSIPIQIINGTAYYRFELDINQVNSADKKNLSLDALQIWQAPSGTLSNYTASSTPDQGTGAFPAGDSATLIYNLDTGGDKFVGLDGNLQPGSGNTVDMSLLVPVSDFDPTKAFVYLYSAYGFQGGSWVTNDGFEEWVTSPGTGLSGHKFNDLNANGIDNSGEPLLSGWTVYIDVNNDNVLEAGEPFTVTDASGFYQFFVQPGTYTIREVTQSGWVQSAPTNAQQEFTITLTAGQTSGNNDFGNFQQAFKTGTKFADLNGNGVQDSGEPGLSGWTILAFADTNSNGTLDQGEFAAGAKATGVTNGSGDYSLTLNPGKYIVVEQTQAGWTESFPGTDVVSATGTGLGETGYAVTLSAGQTDSANNFGNFQQATKSGIKFNDLNGNGAQDSGEPGLAGFTILAFADTNANGTLDQGEFAAGAKATGVTDGSGAYSLTVSPGKYIVVEQTKAGWTESFPGTDVVSATGTGLGETGYSVTLTSGQTEVGNNFGNFQQATKSGIKFNDLNGNGAQDSGEPGLAGFTILAFADTNANGTLDQGEFAAGAKATGVTDGSGAYSLTVNPGKYIVVEQTQAGWTESFPGTDVVSATGTGLGETGYSVTLTSGQTEVGNNFGNFQQATKSGIKFNDLNGNGAQDSGEPGLAGFTILAFADTNANGTLDQGEFAAGAKATGVTDGSGAYSLTVNPGKYIVVEQTKAGWTESFPGTDVVSATGTGLGETGYSVTLTSGQTETGNNFGNFQQAAKSGIKFNDLNGNGAQDSGEPGLAGFTILAFADTNANGTLDQGEFAAGAKATGVTDGSGAYSLTVSPGKYIVVEQTKAGWTESFPGTDVVSATGTGLGETGYSVTLTSGQTETGNNFGNFQQATKSGIKFNDLNGNGAQDSGEPGLAGFTILAFADTNANGTLDQGEFAAGAKATGVTDGSGAYSLTVSPGKYIVVEQTKAGWTESFPGTDVVSATGTGLGETGYSVTLTSGQTETGNNFGNFQQATKSGIKFNDLNGNGAQDFGEPGLAGFTILAFADTNANGTLDQGEFAAGAKATGITDGSGAYSLTVNPGKYIVVEQTQAGWTESFPGTDVVSATGTGLGETGYSVTLTSGQTETGNNFGNFQQATKSGIKFNDLNGNGAQDSGEPGLAGFTILAFADTNANGTLDQGEFAAGAKATGVTDGSGAYSLTVNPGKYIVVEQTQAGWTESFPGTDVVSATGTGLGETGYSVTLTSGQTETGNNFGNFQQATKSGIKFNDLNGNGVQDSGEPGLAGWTIAAYLDSNGNGTLDQGEFTAGAKATGVTNGTGAYSLTVGPGKYIVVEAQQSGWTESTPTTDVVSATGTNLAEGGFAITLTSGQIDSGNNFGNFQVGRGPLTPGFWCNHEWAWDGNLANGPEHGNSLSSLVGPVPAVLRAADILIPVDSNNDGVIDGSDKKGVLIGDLNANGLTDAGEVTIFIDLACAQKIICASNQLISSDRRIAFARQALASQLNVDNGAQAPAGLLTDAAEWLLGYRFNADGSLVPGGVQLYPDGSSGNVTTNTSGSPTFGVAACNPATGAFTAGTALAANKNAFQIGGQLFFTALDDFNNDPPATQSLLVSTNNKVVALVDNQSHIALHTAQNTTNSFLHLVS